MENSISYYAGGKQFNLSTQLRFGNHTDEQTAVKVFLIVCNDRDSRLLNGEIPRKLSDKEQQNMTETAIVEWHLISNIVFMDYASKKKLSMHHMSDVQGSFKVEPIL